MYSIVGASVPIDTDVAEPALFNSVAEPALLMHMIFQKLFWVLVVPGVTHHINSHQTRS